MVDELDVDWFTATTYCVNVSFSQFVITNNTFYGKYMGGGLIVNYTQENWKHGLIYIYISSLPLSPTIQKTLLQWSVGDGGSRGGNRIVPCFL